MSNQNTFHNQRPNGLQTVANTASRLAFIPPNDGYTVVQLDTDAIWIWNAASQTWVADSNGGGGGGGGTVTSVSVATSNGFDGTVANPTTTPSITIGTNVTGILYGNGTGVSAATSGEFPTLNQNTTGTAANITATSNTTVTSLPNLTSASSLIIAESQVTNLVSDLAGKQPTITVGALDAQAGNSKGISLVGNVLSQQSASTTEPGLVNNTTQSFSGNKTFSGTISSSNFSGSSSGTNTGDVTLGTADGLSLSGQVLSLGTASTSTTGALTSTDWNTFNGKQASGNYITALTGDVTATGPGSSAASLTATTNSTLTTLSSLSLPTTQLSGQVTLTQLPTIATNTILGNATAGSAVPTALTGTQTTALLTPFVGDIGSGGIQGVVPAPSANSYASGYYLNAGGTFSYVDQSKNRNTDFSIVASIPQLVGGGHSQNTFTFVHNNGKSYAVVSGGGTTGTAELYDITDQTNPILINNATYTGSYNITAAIISGSTYLFIPASGASTLKIINITNPYSWVVTSTTTITNSPGSIYDAVYANGYVYCATQNKGLTVLDVGGGLSGGTLTAPVQSFQEGGTTNKSFGVAIFGNYVYTTNYQTTFPATIRYLKTWELSAGGGTLAVPFLANTYTIPGGPTATSTKPLGISLSADGLTAFISDGNQNQIDIIDITTPTSPNYLTYITPSYTMNSGYVAIPYGNFLFIPSGSNAINGGAIDMYDITNRSSPIKIDTIYSNLANDVFGGISILGGYIFVGTYGISAQIGPFLVFSMPNVTPVFGASLGSTLILQSLTPNTALISSGSDAISSSITTATELSYVHGVTSPIQTQINSISGSGITALTGDGTATGPGSVPFTLATVNSNVGSFGSASSVATFTTNAKGLTTAAGSTSIQIAESQVTNLVSDLASKQGTVTIGALDSQSANANGLSLVSNVLSTQSASGTQPGLVNTTAQAFGGKKTFNAGLDANSNQITSVLDPTTAQMAATKNYVDTAVAALQPQASVYAATTGSNIPGTYLNGASGIGATFTTTATTTFTLDGTTPPLNSRILIKDQTSGFQNGIYSFTTLPVNGVSGAIFTRTLDYDTAADMNAAGLIPVINGTVNSLSSWQQVASITTVGTDSLVFSEFTANPSLYLLKTNNLTDLSSRQTSLNNLSGAVTSGSFLRGNGTNVTLSTIQVSDVPTLNQNTTGTAASVTGTNVVTNTNLAQMPADTIKGNNTGSTANASDLTVAQVNAILPVFTSSLNGLAPASGGGTTNYLRADGTWDAPSGATSGTVTSVSVVSANGLTGTVATATTTPAITLSTTVTGILQGNGTAISAATIGNLTDSSSGADGITVTNGTGAVIGTGTSISQQSASTSTNGYLNSTDWNTFNLKQNSITTGTTLQYLRGDLSLATLNTTVVPEGTNLYFTNARTLASTLTGYASTTGTISSSDTVLSAIEKLNGNTAPVSGDIAPTTWTGIANNTSGQTVTGLSFATTVSSFECFMNIQILATSNTYTTVKIIGTRRAPSDWSVASIQAEDVGDQITGLAFDISSAGQVTISIGNITGFTSGTVKFRAIVLS